MKVKIEDCSSIEFLKEDFPKRECIGASTIYQNGFFRGVIVNTQEGYGICLSKAYKWEWQAFDEAIDYIDCSVSTPTQAWNNLVLKLQNGEARVVAASEARTLLLESCNLIKNFVFRRFDRLKRIEDFLLEVEAKPYLVNNLPIKQKIYALLGRKAAMRLMRFLPSEVALLELYNKSITNEHYVIDCLEIIDILEAEHGEMFSVDAPILNSYVISIAFGTAKLAPKFRKEIFNNLETAKAIGVANLSQYQLLARYCSRSQNEIFCHFFIYDTMLKFLYQSYCKKDRALFVRTMADFSNYLVEKYQGKISVKPKKK